MIIKRHKIWVVLHFLTGKNSDVVSKGHKTCALYITKGVIYITVLTCQKMTLNQKGLIEK